MAYTVPTHNPAAGVIIPSSYGDNVRDSLTALNTMFCVPLFPRSSGQVPLSGLTAAAYSVVQSSGAGTVKPQYPVLAFASDADEGRMWCFTMPRGYGATLTVNGAYYTTAVAGTVVFVAQLAVISDGDTGVTAKVYDAANALSAQTVPGVAATEETFSITMTNADSGAANDRCYFTLFRDISEDTAAADILLTRLDLFFNLEA